jgi:hypothetical protein
MRVYARNNEEENVIPIAHIKLRGILEYVPWIDLKIV